MATAPTLYWYQLTVGTYAPLYYNQLDTSVRSLCVENGVLPPTANWYSATTGTIVSDWAVQVDAAVRELCVLLNKTAPTQSVINLTYGQLSPAYTSSLDACVRDLCSGIPVPPQNPTSVTWTKLGSTKFVSATGNGGTTTNVNATGAQAILLGVQFYDTQPEPTLSDNVGVIGYLAARLPLVTSGHLNLRPYVILNPAANAVSGAMNWTITGTSNFSSIYCEVWNNDQPTFPVLLQQYISTNYNSSVRSNICNPLTNAAVTDLGFTFFMDAAVGTITASDSFTIDQSNAFTTGQHFGGACQHFVYSSQILKTPASNWTAANGNNVNDKCNIFLIAQSGTYTPLRLTNFEDHAIIPVNPGDTTATPTFSGVYNLFDGTPASIEIQIEKTDGTVLQAWAAASSPTFNTVAGTFSCVSPTIPQGSNYVARARTKTGGAVVIETSNTQSNLWGVSNMTIAEGPSQSHLYKMNAQVSSPGTPNDWLRLFGVGNIGTVPSLTYQLPIGNGYIAMGNALIAARAGTGLGGTDIPVLVVCNSVSGAGITGAFTALDPAYNYWLSTDTNINAPYQRFQYIFAGLHGVPNIMLHCGGSTDSILPTPPTYTALYNGTVQARANMLGVMGRTTSQMPFFIMSNGRANDGTTTDAHWQLCKDVDIDLGNNGVNCFPAASIYDLPLQDAYHLTAAGYGHAGLRIAQSILHYLDSVTYPNDGVSVKIVSASRVAAVVTVTLDLNGGTALNFADGTTVGTGQVGWQVSTDNFNTFLTISSTAFTTNKPVLTLSADPGAACKLRYIYGKQGTLDLTKVDYNDVFPQSDTLQEPLMFVSSQNPVVVS